MELKQLIILALQISILCTVFGFGLKATTADLLYLVHRPGLLVRSLLAVFVIMPAVAVALAYFFHFRPTVEVALIALAISPVPPLLPTKQAKAGGDASYGIGLMATLAVLAIVLVPLAADVIGRFAERPITASPASIAPVVIKALLVPLVAGIALHRFAPALAERLERPVGLIAKVLLPVAVLALLVAVGPALKAVIGDGTIIAMALFVAIGLAVGHVLGGPEPDHSAVLALASACRHPAIALGIASANVPDASFGATIVLYLLVSAVVCVPYLRWRGRQDAGAVRGASPA
jgi:BASS family bile acid:Na+ symporter